MTSLKYMNMPLESLQRKKIDSFLFAFSGLIRMITVIWFFRFCEFEPIKLYLCSHSSCQCRLIYARKNIETQTATKYFITGTKNFISNLYPFCRKWCTNTVSVLEKSIFLQHTFDILITFQNGCLMGTAWKYDVK